MLFRKRQFRLAGELRNPKYEALRSASMKEKREKIGICVVDDNPFEPKKNLENAGYRITFLGDVNTIEAVTNYHIVLCDLMGVGTALDERKQGAFLIKEIKKNFPEKYVVAYTGGASNQTISREAAVSADFFLKKDADIEQWVETLDALIIKLLNPYQVWQRQRLALVQREVDTQTIIKLEDAFVGSIVQGNDFAKSKFREYVSSDQLPRDARAIIQGMIASGLYALLFG